MDDLYRENILDHFKNPRNKGHLDAPDMSYEDSNPLCGDQIGVELRVADNQVKAARFHGHGCAISQASASMLMEMVEGMSLDEVKQLNKEDVFELLGISLSPVRIKCALLSLKVLKAGVYGLKGEMFDDEEAG